MADGMGGGVVDAALDAAGAVVDTAADELKKTASQTFGQITGNQTQKQTSNPDPTLQQRAQQDKTESSQKEDALKRELRMIAHQNAQGLSTTQEHPQQSAPEEAPRSLPELGSQSSQNGQTTTPLPLHQALTKTESGRNTKG